MIYSRSGLYIRVGRYAAAIAMLPCGRIAFLQWLGLELKFHARVRNEVPERKVVVSSLLQLPVKC